MAAHLLPVVLSAGTVCSAAPDPRTASATHDYCLNLRCDLYRNVTHGPSTCCPDDARQLLWSLILLLELHTPLLYLVAW